MFETCCCPRERSFSPLLLEGRCCITGGKVRFSVEPKLGTTEAIMEFTFDKYKTWISFLINGRNQANIFHLYGFWFRRSTFNYQKRWLFLGERRCRSEGMPWWAERQSVGDVTNTIGCNEQMKFFGRAPRIFLVLNKTQCFWWTVTVPIMHLVIGKQQWWLAIKRIIHQREERR